MGGTRTEFRTNSLLGGLRNGLPLGLRGVMARAVVGAAAAACVGGGVGVGVASAQPTGFWTIPTMPGEAGVLMRAVSGDGRVVGGNSYTPVSPTGPTRIGGFRWTPEAGRMPIPLDGFGRELQALDRTGTTAVGVNGAVSFSAAPISAFRQASPSDPVEVLAIPPGRVEARGQGVSDDGRVMVIDTLERARPSLPGTGHAYVWTPEGGSVELSSGGVGETFVDGISGDGRTILGRRGLYTPVTWHDRGEPVPLPTLPGVGFQWYANAISRNGQFIAGGVELVGGSRGVIWGPDGPRILDNPVGAGDAIPKAISDDSQVLIASFTLTAGPRTGDTAAFVWTEAGGFVTLEAYVATFGITVPSDLRLTDVLGMSADGRTMAGNAVTSSGELVGFVAIVPGPAGVVVFGMGGLSACRRRR